MAEITTLLQSARDGDDAALERLYQLLYADLRRIAHAKLRQVDGITLLNTTSLVHESYLRMAKVGHVKPEDRSHFLAYAARAMRSVVVDFARARLAERRGGGVMQVTLDTDAAEHAATNDSELVRVHEALDELAKIDQRLVQVVEMRYFAGLDDREIADALGVSTRTVSRDWEKARLYLYANLK